MRTHKSLSRHKDYVSQSRVVKSDDNPLPRWQVHLLRNRSCFSGKERRGWVLFVSVGRYRFEVGTR